MTKKTEDWTNKELEQGIKKMADSLGDIGIRGDEYAEGVKKLAKYGTITKEENMKYNITSSKNADTRTATLRTKESLHLDTLKHLKDVQSVMALISIQLQKQGIKHDHTKIDYLDNFYQDWKEGTEGFVNKEWYQKHITEERHHSNSYLHKDFNLLDLIEEIVDKVCAGKGRTGEINLDYFKYDDETLQLALENTITYIDELTTIS